MDRPSFYASSFINLGRLWCRSRRRRHALVGHARRRQRPSRGHTGRPLHALANEPESITLPKGTTQEHGPTTLDAFQDLGLCVKESARNSFNWSTPQDL